LTLVIKQFILLKRVFRDDQLAADPIQEHNCRLICARFLEGIITLTLFSMANKRLDRQGWLILAMEGLKKPSPLHPVTDFLIF
jgi:hypothetical protein